MKGQLTKKTEDFAFSINLRRKREVGGLNNCISVFLYHLFHEIGDRHFISSFISKGWSGKIRQRDSEIKSNESAVIMIDLSIPGEDIQILLKIVSGYYMVLSLERGYFWWQPLEGSVRYSGMTRRFSVYDHPRPVGKYDIQFVD